MGPIWKRRNRNMANVEQASLAEALPLDLDVKLDHVIERD